MIKTIQQNILTTDQKYICHQVNSFSNKGAGLAKDIFATFPYADIYSKRPYPYKKINQEDLPGQIIVKGDGVSQRFIINLIAQYFPGKPNRYDTKEKREGWFKFCLGQIIQIPNIETIAFPAFIGCGLAGGDWNNYRNMLEWFTTEVNKNQKVEVFLCQK